MNQKKEAIMVKQKKKKKMGRPPKPPEEKTVQHLSIGFNAKLSKTIDKACHRINVETGGRFKKDVNAQFVIKNLVEKLARDLKRSNFSFLKEYLETNGWA